MKRTLLYVFIVIDLVVRALPPDTLARRKHFAFEADVAYANARINPIRDWHSGETIATLKAPGFMCYNFSLVYNWRGFTRDCDDPVHEFSIASGASLMKMKIEQSMRNHQTSGYDYSSDVSYSTEKINFNYTPTELNLLFRYTYSTKKYFIALNAGVSTVLVNESKNTVIQSRKDNVTYTSSGASYETVYSDYTVDHYLVPNKSINNILGVRVGLNGKTFNPYFTIQRHGANTYNFMKFGIGAMLLF